MKQVNLPSGKIASSAARTGTKVMVKKAPARPLEKADVHQLRLMMQRELEMAKQMRLEARKYQLAIAEKARSEAQQLILRTRLQTQKEVEELVSNAQAEIQKMIADIRVIRITAQEELAAQRKFTNAAKLNTLSSALRNEVQGPELKRLKELISK
jgi:F0F1-type ATP synthase membrane subunit b/b'